MVLLAVSWKDEHEAGKSPERHLVVLAPACFPAAAGMTFAVAKYRRHRPQGCHWLMDSLQEQRLMCSHDAGRKRLLRRNVTCSMTNETTEALNLAHYSQMLRRSQPLACTSELGYLNRWPAFKDRRSRGRTVSWKGTVTSLPSEPSKRKGPVNFGHGNNEFLRTP